MTTRDEILAALTDNPAGLTSKELAPLCPAAECDAQIVGRVIAQLRQENVIHPGTELRDGGTIWVFGKGIERDPVNEPALPQPVISKHAQAIAAMRAPKAAAERAPDRAPKPVTTPSPARPAALPEATMKEKKPLAERVVEALRAHGNMTLEQLAKRVETTVQTLYTMMGTLKKRGVTAIEKRGNAPSIYGFAASAPRRDVLAAGAEIGRQAPPKQKTKPPRINGRAPGAAPSAGDAQFAINENGDLGIEKDGSKLMLCRSELGRLRTFIQRCEQILDGAETAA
jgi:hypothetical protein